MSKMKLSLIGVSGVVFLAIVFWLGMAIGTRFVSGQLESELNSAQAMLAFNRILEGRQIGALLAKGCVAQALEKTNIAMDQDTKLIASLFNGKLSPQVSKYISDRDPSFLRSLDGFKSKYGDAWIEPECGR